MSDPLLDPAALFTPPRKKHAARQFLDHVDAPTLSPNTKGTYQEASQFKSRLSEPLPVDEVIGEYTYEGQEPSKYYYARYQDGIAHRYPATKFEQGHPDLVAEYLRKKTMGELKEFSPNAHYIHPKSRVRLTIKLKSSASSAGSAPPSSSDMGEVTDSDQGEDEEDDEDEDAYESESVAPLRRSTRAKTQQSRKSRTVDSDSDEEPAAPRRSSRRKAARTPSTSYEEEEEESDGYESAPKAKKRSKAPRKLAIRPAYGHVGSIADVDCDYHADADTAPLRSHRSACEKCGLGPTHELIEAEQRKQRRGKKKSKRKSAEDEFDSRDELERLTDKGGWVRCLKCPVVVHWGCLSASDRNEILKAIRDVDREAWRSTQPASEIYDEDGQPKPNKNEPRKRAGLDPQQMTDFVCRDCSKTGICIGCHATVSSPPDVQPAAEPASLAAAPAAASADVEMKPALKYDADVALLFRCLGCRRAAHYEHLHVPEHLAGKPIWDIANHYMSESNWLCADCSSFESKVVDKILAWRPYPATATEPALEPDELPDIKQPLPREYLVKWMNKSYGRAQWVPHMWLFSKHQSKLKNFVATGPKVELLEQPIGEEEHQGAETTQFQVVVESSRQSSTKPGSSEQERPQGPLPDAEKRIPLAWKTVDRVLDLNLWRPRNARQKKGKRTRIDSDADDDLEDEFELEKKSVREGLVEPSGVFSETLADWESRTRQKFSIEHIDQVSWAYLKWGELTYDQATWDCPPSSDDALYPAFVTALERFIAARDVCIKPGTKTQMPNRPKEGFASLRLTQAADLDLGQDPAFKLMDFQVDGFNWLCDNWWNEQPCILADEMGLGKTVQIATFIGKIVQDFSVSPALVVVPNATITNWGPARKIIRDYELMHHEKRKDCLSIKYHVLVTTYDTIIGTDFSTVFKSQPRWEASEFSSMLFDRADTSLVKSDNSLLFRKLNELRTLHRVIMTGTPLNNNIRELFNLMNFLDPKQWADLEALEKEHEELTEDLIKDLHARLRPYFLRRIKSQVLKLPPKNEVIVPVSMAPLQKEIYRSILSKSRLSKKKTGVARGKLNNVLMHLRKCLQHPYLYEDTIEPRGLSKQETHYKLIDASAKLRLLKVLLPKLKARGHRVLLFSQFVIALDIIEDFLVGEGLKFLRLDGNTKGSERQKGMDEFNREGSDVFIYLLTTRAGGVGINLYTADTVIIFDPDFNPHQDLQAIARAYRYGQKNTCLVFKLMVWLRIPPKVKLDLLQHSDRPHHLIERIIQVGKKKLVLDHLIVQKMDDDEEGGDNVDSILTFGAQALFAEDPDARDIVYSDNDIDKLIEKTEQEAAPEQSTGEEGAFSFAFAKVWAAEKDTLEDVVEEDVTAESWAQALKKMNENRELDQVQEMERYGRGKQRAAANRRQNYAIDDSPVKSKSRAQSMVSNDSAYASGDGGDSSDSGDDSEHVVDTAVLVAEALNQAAEQQPPKRKKKADLPLPTAQNSAPLPPPCSLCGDRHSDQLGACLMTENSEHLAEFREMLILHADDEPLDKRLAAVAAIDEVLYQRGHVHLIHGQPLEIIDHGLGQPSDIPAKRHKVQAETPVIHSVPVASAPAPTNAVASSSKRTLSPGPGSTEGPHKKPRQSPSSETCQVCKSSPHPVQECPVIADASPKKLSQEIKRLEEHPGTTKTVDALRKILSVRKKQEVANQEIIDLSDL
ncbi:SNF2 family DNA-dependent ATPase [Mycena chlorophos]|uniref:SNF2 family DNA-dependent ATPase n=1 Tax=Mycena chlorophos TaxID=658473 RepID=A0A8H6T5I3_MYCCL|nr:SNF2 family DNA-dependent ATPase [Mycena chlorophos]